jgi:hypothetical protein
VTRFPISSTGVLLGLGMTLEQITPGLLGSQTTSFIVVRRECEHFLP